MDTGRFRENSPADLATSALGINYNPNHKEMPCTKRFLKTIADGDDDLYELMLQVIGYILSNDIRAKSFFYLEGVGDAGKSRFCDLIASFFPVTGPNKVARVALQDLGGKFALGNLVNAKSLPSSRSFDFINRQVSGQESKSNSIPSVRLFSFKPLCLLTDSLRGHFIKIFPLPASVVKFLPEDGGTETLRLHDTRMFH